MVLNQRTERTGAPRGILTRVWLSLVLGALGLPVAPSSAQVSARSVPVSLAKSSNRTDGIREQLILRDSLFFPEGLDADVRSGAMYITSMAHGRVVRVDASGAVRDVLPSGSEPMAAVFGVAVDTARDVLWLTTAPHPQRTASLRARNVRGVDTRAALLQVRARDGTMLKRWWLGDSTSMPGELAVMPNGDVVVSDGIRGRLYRLRGGDGEVQEVAHPLLRSPQGIAPRADGRVAWIADWSRGLLRWDTATDSLTQVLLPQGGLLRGIDGLRAHNGWLITVQNGATPTRVVALRLDRDGARIEEVRVLDTLSEWNGEPTVGSVMGGEFVYVSTSQWPHWTETGERRGTAVLPPVVVRRVPLVGSVMPR